MLKNYFISCTLLLSISVPLRCTFAQTHAGEHDTDGILSPGEIPNKHINYDKAQREAESRGDYRVENPDNDALAEADSRGHNSDWGKNRKYNDDFAWREQQERDARYRDGERRGSSWWPW